MYLSQNLHIHYVQTSTSFVQMLCKKGLFRNFACSSKLFTPISQYFYTDMSVISVKFCKQIGSERSYSDFSPDVPRSRLCLKVCESPHLLLLNQPCHVRVALSTSTIALIVFSPITRSPEREARQLKIKIQSSTLQLLPESSQALPLRASGRPTP